MEDGVRIVHNFCDSLILLFPLAGVTSEFPHSQDELEVVFGED
ncbi:hypothetical protein GQS_07645 [Thermococcus sp. 4557]|nr:hypothetical protein GQS_07645 [Thermococcus sp. 4557]